MMKERKREEWRNDREEKNDGVVILYKLSYHVLLCYDVMKPWFLCDLHEI